MAKKLPRQGKKNPTNKGMGKIKPLYKKGDLLREKNVTEDSVRSPFRRDFARLIHSAAFRRLQGKTQLFPLSESDFFRNRLTHSLEVAQIAKSIAILINKKFIKRELGDIPIEERDKYCIDYDLIEFSALAHDLGHPPFGHQGESALDECMRQFGGFESNAQNLHILTRVEKKEKNTAVSSGIESRKDKRLGLNLTYRSLASILKYDKQIPYIDPNREKPIKGYYKTETSLVKKIKKSIVGSDSFQNFKTIECQIMDIADDIAYSTYDFEDAIKNNFLSPMGMLCETDMILEEVAKSVRESIDDDTFGKENVIEFLHQIFKGIAGYFDIRRALEEYSEGANENIKEYDRTIARIWAVQAFFTSRELCINGYFRTGFTSSLVNNAVNSINFDINTQYPPLSKVSLDADTRKTVEVLKHFVYHAVVQKARLQLVESRGRDIVTSIFNKIDSKGGDKFLPRDFRELYNSFSYNNIDERKRIIADFIASMTDRYAIEFYKRLFSVESETIFKEL